MQNLSLLFRSVTTTLILCSMYAGSASSQTMPALPPNHLTLPARSYTIPFYWQGDSVNGSWEAHAAILIPVHLKGCPKQFFMQFDLGSPYSLFYKNKLAAIGAKYPKAITTGDDDGKLVNFSFNAGKMPIMAKEIVVKQFDSSSVDWNKKSIEIIGTLGVDLIDGKTMVIDYPAKKLVISGSISKKLNEQVSLTNFIYAGRRILLPANLNGKQTMLYFDTGSSMYQLLTDKKTCEAMAAPGSLFIQSKVWSWDKYLTANSIATNDSITISGVIIPVHYATYIDGVDAAQAGQMSRMGIGGMTGNKLFLNYQLVLDTRNKKMGLLRSK